MKNIMYNAGYFIKETGKIIKNNLLSNIVSFISISFILFVLSLMFMSWEIGNYFVERLKEEAEISVYVEEVNDLADSTAFLKTIEGIDGVLEAKLIGEEEAYQRMEDVLGDEASMLQLFDYNPFDPFVEIRIDLEQMEPVLEELKKLEGIHYIRENRDLLEQMQRIIQGIRVIGILVLTAVSITTFVITSHMIREGIYRSREQITTLKLLGAPNYFIHIPFVLLGVFLMLLGGMAATALMVLLIHQGYNNMGGILPMIPLPAKEDIIISLIPLTMGVSLFLGVWGSVFGLSSIKKKG